MAGTSLFEPLASKYDCALIRHYYKCLTEVNPAVAAVYTEAQCFADVQFGTATFLINM